MFPFQESPEDFMKALNRAIRLKYEAEIKYGPAWLSMADDVKSILRSVWSSPRWRADTVDDFWAACDLVYQARS